MLWIALILVSLQERGLPAELAELFEYDGAVALDVNEISSVERDGARIRDITFASPVSGRVTAYVVEPLSREHRPVTTKRRYAGIVFGHWGPGNRTEFLPEATLYARAGAVSVLVDYPWKRPAPWWSAADGPNEPEKERELYRQAVIDLRRAIDLLRLREDVDPARIAYVGHSYGAQWGAILSAVDDRVKAAVLMAGIPDTACITLGNQDPGFVAYCNSLPEGALKRYLEIIEVFDPVRYVPHAAPTPLFFQFARLERDFTEDEMRRYAAAASEPKSVIWYDTGHELNDPMALVDRAAWLRERVRIGPVEIAGR